MHIRRTTIDDAALLVQLNAPIQQLHIDAVPGRFKPVEPDNPAMIAAFAERLASEEWVGYVAEIDGEPAGYMLCQIRLSPDNAFKYAETTLMIDQISVNPDYQRRGCGQALVQAALELAQEVGTSSVILDVWDFNEGALAFYQAMNFQPTMHRLKLSLEKSE